MALARVEPQRAPLAREGRSADLEAQRAAAVLRLLADEAGVGPAEIAEEVRRVVAEPDQGQPEAEIGPRPASICAVTVRLARSKS